jgi:hypothetical protein
MVAYFSSTPILLPVAQYLGNFFLRVVGLSQYVYPIERIGQIFRSIRVLVAVTLSGEFLTAPAMSPGRRFACVGLFVPVIRTDRGRVRERCGR